MTQEEKERREMDRDPLERLNNARTKRLEEAYFAELREEEMLEEGRDLLEELGINKY